jgi:predicted Holliday junction resolvase-like endonuclease
MNAKSTDVICSKCKSRMYFFHTEYPIPFDPQDFLEQGDPQDLCVYGCLKCENLMSVSGNTLSEKERKLLNNINKMSKRFMA